ncbi:MAG TPA: thiamine-phosphate kinase [Gemmatimonadaceae bacterium]|nr:thiamine-phosphate kinase [Gemmatimonadaceae bacterium]
MSAGAALGPGREFDLIRHLLARWGSRAQGVGDDAAVLDVPRAARLVASTDSAIENVHFRREWLAPEEIGWRAAMAALSDLAAMAAQPLGVLVALSVPDRWRDDIPALADGIGAAAEEAGARIVGGDLTGAGELAIGITVLGAAAAPLLRGGARPGDTIYVTGTLGGPRAALRAWSRGETPTPAQRERFARPVARLREAAWLARHGATAGIDISDGLLADLAHVSVASGVRMAVALDELPVVSGASREDAARSGEEYELAVTAPPGLDSLAFERAFGVPLTPIGRVEAGAPGVEATLGGERVAPGGGWDHFS